MANNLLDLEDIITEMRTQWTGFRCDEGQANNNGFHFGWAHEVDELHNKNLPLMVVNPPSASLTIDDIEHQYGKSTNQFTIQIYEYVPSTMYGQNSVYISSRWDNIENCFYVWLENLLNTLTPQKCVLSSGTLNITRTKDASNDALLMSQFTFNLLTYRKCLTLN